MFTVIAQSNNGYAVKYPTLFVKGSKDNCKNIIPAEIMDAEHKQHIITNCESRQDDLQFLFEVY